MLQRTTTSTIAATNIYSAKLRITASAPVSTTASTTSLYAGDKTLYLHAELVHTGGQHPYAMLYSRGWVIGSN